MNKDLKSYVKHYKSWLGEDLCKESVKQLEYINWQEHQFYNVLTGNGFNMSGDQELQSSFDEISTKDKIMERIWYAYDKYLKDLNFHWYTGWNGFSRVRFNRYAENKKMAEHCDHIHDLFDGERKGIPTMTALCLLNDDYIGGEFIMWTDEKIELNQGDVIIFPSCFLYPHRVDPVLSGVRYSCVAWSW